MDDWPDLRLGYLMASTLTTLRKKAREANLSVTTRATAKELLVLTRKPTAGKRMRASFFLIGSMKAGTTSLFNNLVFHPQIAEPISKEIRYFDFHYSKGARWYLAHFPLKRVSHKRGETISGEASPSYLFDPHAPERIKHFAPDAKLVILLRNPVDRAYSHYQHAVRYWGETRSFADAIKVEETWIGEEQEKRIHDPQKMGVRRIQHSYLTRGLYLEQLHLWDSAFGRENLLILRAEDYFEHPETVMPDVLDFLKIDKWQPENFKRLNMASYQKLDAEIRTWAYDYFSKPNSDLYDYLGRSMDWEEMQNR
jgi:Sulfotransferase domain